MATIPTTIATHIQSGHGWPKRTSGSFMRCRNGSETSRWITVSMIDLASFSQTGGRAPLWFQTPLILAACDASTPRGRGLLSSSPLPRSGGEGSRTRSGGGLVALRVEAQMHGEGLLDNQDEQKQQEQPWPVRQVFLGVLLVLAGQPFGVIVRALGVVPGGAAASLDRV